MLKNLNLKQKVTILLLIILIAGLGLSGITLSAVLTRNAREEISSTALVLMETMSSIRNYTSTQINPELAEKLETTFLPQTVPAYYAREVFEVLRQKSDYRDFFYKEATLNPTNLRDKADEFERKIVEGFRTKGGKELNGFRSLPGGDIFYIARPLAVTEQKCLDCHDTPDRAPKSMIDRYGANNGFGWKLNEIVGAQVIYVPASKVIQKAYQSSFLIITIVSIVFLAVILLINIFLNQQVVIPLKRITRVAEEISMGHMEVDFDQLSNDEIGNLAKAFKRMKLSLEKAMNRLKHSGRTGGGAGGSTKGESTNT
jgi:HAMP domain-containing protein